MSRSGKGDRGWNGKLTLSEARSKSHIWEVTRKLEDVCRDLAPLEEQGKVEGFFNNFENAGKLSGLVEDIRDAMMEYQVYIHDSSVFRTSNVCARLPCSKISTKVASYSL